MTTESLEAAIRKAGSAVELLRNSPARPYVFPVAPEFTNWHAEQRAWRESCALLDQSHHMADLYLSGPDAGRLLSDLGVNSFRNFGVDRAKQFVAVNHEGQFIGDGILFHLEEELFDLVGLPMVIDWVQYHLEVGGYDAVAERDENSVDRVEGPPKVYRYELQGPSAPAVLEEATGTPVPEIRFFHMGEFRIAGRRVRALRHGMAGQPGFELFGPWDDGTDVLDALLQAGRAHGLRRAGAKAYSTANLESGWLPSPVPAIYTDERLRDYREWLGTSTMGSLGGSFASGDITDYYVTPYDLGYGRSVAFDHDFVGRDALFQIVDGRHRKKVTLVWDREDVTAAIGSQLGDGLPAKYIDLPKSRYALFQCDAVVRGGSTVGISMDCGYIANEQAMVSLAVVDASVAEPGTEVTVLWGEEPNSAKPQVEPHRQVEIRATVAPVPYAEYARSLYRVG